MFDWLVHSLGAWMTWAAAAALWLSSRSRRKAFWVWLTRENFYKNFGFLGLLWPQREGKRVWPEVMDDAKITYLQRLEKARQFREGQIPKWEVAIANIRLSGHMAFLIVEMTRAIDLIAFLKRRPSSETAEKRPRIVNVACRMEARGGMRVTGVVSPKLVDYPTIHRPLESPES
jgi:hypothetical protein